MRNVSTWCRTKLTGAFSAALFSFPAGLTLYWVTNNALTILQQWMINRGIEGEKAKGLKATDAKIVKG